MRPSRFRSESPSSDALKIARYGSSLARSTSSPRLLPAMSVATPYGQRLSLPVLTARMH